MLLLRGTYHAQPSECTLCMQCRFCGYLHMQCSSLRALAKSSSLRAHILASHGTLCMQCSSHGALSLHCMKLLRGTLQSNSHTALAHLSKWHCMNALWGTSQCNSHGALTHLSKWHCSWALRRATLTQHSPISAIGTACSSCGALHSATLTEQCS